MKTKLDLQTWNRKDHFQFFNTFEEPFFGVCVEMDCTRTYQLSKESGESFFILYLHKALAAANAIESFRYRIIDDEVWKYDEVHASATINRPNGTFGFSFIDFHPDFTDFKKLATDEIIRVQNSEGLKRSGAGENVIHFSALPWIKFTSLSHARNFQYKDSCPKISFSKTTKTNGKVMMNISIHVHHALMDGYEVGLFIDEYQRLLNL
ncbi:chloramphenicol acetyltransferase [Pedobacter sp. HMF7647]|uniref:Chloramphenicol acetyltransferase n=1 Tax=Hufsiella arboris TaxID=2695275 RepID=A0A7K1Y6P5_9SPHI|nr:chloramphenicol acetyltransferase [Hufsiella arboris]MXV50237.1 chloramphenicol acetyltransferase [Hufsiella arboris]